MMTKFVTFKFSNETRSRISFLFKDSIWYYFKTLYVSLYIRSYYFLDDCIMCFNIHIKWSYIYFNVYPIVCYSDIFFHVTSTKSFQAWVKLEQRHQPIRHNNGLGNLIDSI